MSITLAWHGRQELKDEVMARLRAHRAQDEIIQGLYQLANPKLAGSYRGCAIGCTLPLQPLPDHPGATIPDSPDGGWHAEVERLYGIPYWIADLIDDIFENLDPPAHAVFAVEVIEAIPVGVDLIPLATEIETSLGGDWFKISDPDVTAARLIERLRTAPVQAVSNA